jgi:ribonuclease E
VIEIAPPPPKTHVTPSALEPIVLPPDLELVETNPDNLRAAASRVEPLPPPRPPRVRPPLPPVSDEPLIQVDTRK